MDCRFCICKIDNPAFCRIAMANIKVKGKFSKNINTYLTSFAYKQLDKGEARLHPPAGGIFHGIGQS